MVERTKVDVREELPPRREAGSAVDDVDEEFVL
jgi:hypothetical protein